MKMKLSPPWKRAAVQSSRDRYREAVAGLATRALGILETADRKAFLETEIRDNFGFRCVKILLKPEGPERFSSESTRVRDILSRVFGILEGTRTTHLNETVAAELGVLPVLRSMDVTHAFPIRRGDTRFGILAIDTASQNQLDAELEKILLNVCSQVAIVLENSALLKGKLELQDALARQAQMAQLGEMTARIAHEIKNPLSAIKTIIQLMQEDPELQPRYSRDLELINGEVDRLGNTVMQLLDFARPPHGKQEAVCLREAADAALRFLDHDLRQGGIGAENDIPKGLPPVPGSQSAFREIFLNLILNAIQAGGAGTRLWLQGWEGVLEDGSERFILLVVEDDGPGIPADLQAKVFTPFFTTKQKGTGLGLAIVRRDVEHMGGRVTLESPARGDHGTRFLIHLPLQ